MSPIFIRVCRRARSLESVFVIRVRVPSEFSTRFHGHEHEDRLASEMFFTSLHTHFFSTCWRNDATVESLEGAVSTRSIPAWVTPMAPNACR
jgi:hypothetical protein